MKSELDEKDNYKMYFIYYLDPKFDRTYGIFKKYHCLFEANRQTPIHEKWHKRRAHYETMNSDK
jgi:hypothetical protein